MSAVSAFVPIDWRLTVHLFATSVALGAMLWHSFLGTQPSPSHPVPSLAPVTRVTPAPACAVLCCSLLCVARCVCENSRTDQFQVDEAHRVWYPAKVGRNQPTVTQRHRSLKSIGCSVCGVVCSRLFPFYFSLLSIAFAAQVGTVAAATAGISSRELVMAGSVDFFLLCLALGMNLTNQFVIGPRVRGRALLRAGEVRGERQTTNRSSFFLRV
jgi:hypothetical protein